MRKLILIAISNISKSLISGLFAIIARTVCCTVEHGILRRRVDIFWKIVKILRQIDVKITTLG